MNVKELEEISSSEYTSAITYYDESTSGMLIEGKSINIQVLKTTTDEELAQFADRIVQDASGNGFEVSQQSAMKLLNKLRNEAAGKRRRR